MFIVRVPIELTPLRKAKGYYPLAFALAPRRLGCKTIPPRDKPSRSAAELYGERDDHSVFWGCQLDWHSDCERVSFAGTTDSRSPRLATSPLCVNGCPFPPPGALRRVMPSCPTSSCAATAECALFRVATRHFFDDTFLMTSTCACGCRTRAHQQWAQLCDFTNERTT